MANSPTTTISTQGIQLQLLKPSHRSPVLVPDEPKGIVYTKRWVVELLLELCGYSPEKTWWMPWLWNQRRAMAHFLAP